MRIPGEGTDQADQSQARSHMYIKKSTTNTFVTISYISTLKMDIRLLNLSKEPAYAILLNMMDVQKCMSKLRSFHEMDLQVDHEFDLFRQIDYYESLWDGRKVSVYKDYLADKGSCNVTKALY